MTISAAAFRRPLPLNTRHEPCLLSGKQDEKTHCLTGGCSPDSERCLAARVPVASLISRPSHSSPSQFEATFLDPMLALWSCGRRGSVVQA